MSRVVVRRVTPHLLHGFRRNQLVLDNLREGLNLVYAPNATGKSTLAKAIGLLLNSKGCGIATIEGTLEFNGITQDHVSRSGGESLEGAPERPEDYILDIVSLLSGLGKHESELNEVLGQGIDLKVPSRPTANAKLTSTAVQKRDALATARAYHSTLAHREAERPILQARLEEANLAKRNAELLEKYLQYRTQTLEIEQLKSEATQLLESFPGLDLQVANGAGGVNTYEVAVRQAEHALQRAEADFRSIRPDAARPAVGLASEDRQQYTDLRAAIASALGDIKELQRRANSAHVTAKQARETILNLAHDEHPDSLPAPTLEDFQAVERALLDLEKHRRVEAKQRGFEAVRESWSDKLPEPITDAEAMLDRIKRWCEYEAPAAIDDRATKLLTVAVASLVVAFLPSLPLRIVAALILAAVAVWFFRQVPQPSANNERGQLALAAGLPADAKADQVVRRMSEILDAQQRRGVADLIDAMIRSLDRSDFDWEAVAKELRLRPSDPGMVLTFGKSVETYRKATEEFSVAESEVALAQSNLEQARGQLSHLVAQYGYSIESDEPEHLGDAFLDWFKQSEQLTRAEADLESARSQLKKFLSQSGISVATEAELSDLVQQFQHRTEPARRLRELQDRAKSLEESLGRQPMNVGGIGEAVGLPNLELLSTEEVEGQKQHRQALAAEVDQLVAEIAAINAEVNNAERVHSVANAEAEYQAEFLEVEGKFANLVSASAAYRVKKALVDRLRRVEVPNLVIKANEWLARFTSDRYRLQIAASDLATEALGRLCVYDVQNDTEQSFAQLSTGTKVHVVLALRLGLIEEHEQVANQGTRQFPLIADEVMAVSDPEASRALASALVEIAESRQVVVFTNQPDDVRLFRELAPDVEAQPLGSAEVPVADAVTDLPSHRRPHGAHRIDGRRPILSHAPIAVLPAWTLTGLEDCRDMSEALLRLGDQAAWLQRIIDAVEETRKWLATEYPRLEWSAVKNEEWVTNTYSAELERILEEHRGSATLFLASVKDVKGMRKKDLVAPSLERLGALGNAPTDEQVREHLRKHLGSFEDLFTVDHVSELLVAAFA